MNVLGFDTATPATAVGLRLAGGRTLQARDDPPPGGHPGHATRLLSMAGGLLADAGLGFGALDRIAVGIGPGTFTGLRVGVATARGLAQSLSLELVGVSSLQALAEPVIADGAVAGVLAVIDARRGEVFVAAYTPDGDSSAAELLAPRALGPEDLEEFVAGAIARGATQGAEAASAPGWLAVGDGAVRFRGHLEGAGVAVAEDGSRFNAVGAGALCDLGARARPVTAYEEVVPHYGRRPDAEIALEGVAVLKGSEP